MAVSFHWVRDCILGTRHTVLVGFQSYPCIGQPDCAYLQSVQVFPLLVVSPSHSLCCFAASLPSSSGIWFRGPCPLSLLVKKFVYGVGICEWLLLFISSPSVCRFAVSPMPWLCWPSTPVKWWGVPCSLSDILEIGFWLIQSQCAHGCQFVTACPYKCFSSPATTCSLSMFHLLCPQMCGLDVCLVPHPFFDGVCVICAFRFSPED